MSSRLFPNGAGISIDTMDGHLDLSDVTWQHIAPCGCVSGLSIAAMPGEMTVTADQAMRCFAETTAEYERDKERGFTCRPREHRKACDEAKLECPHEPKWGYARPPKPKGYVWAAVYALGSRPKLTHLVTVAAVKAARDRDYSRSREKPLCGGNAEFHWHDENYATFGKVECKRCIARADRIEAAS